MDSSVQFSRSVMSDSLRPHELQHARPPCPLPTSRVHSDSHPLSQWCHPAISSSVVPFSSCPQSLPASEFFPMVVNFWSYPSLDPDLALTSRDLRAHPWPSSVKEGEGWESLSDLPPVVHGARPRSRPAGHWPHAFPFHPNFKQESRWKD